MTNILFDTNAAREYVAGVKIEDLESYARQMASQFDEKGLRLMITPTVIMELLCHLSDTSDHDYSVCYKAIKAMMLTYEYQNGKQMNEYLSPAELLVINEIYHMRSQTRENMYSSLMAAAVAISHSDIENLPDLHTADGGFISDYVNEIEDSFANQIRKVCNSTEIMAVLAKSNDFDSFLNRSEQECLLAAYFTRTSYNLLMNEGKLPDYKEFIPPYAPQTPDNMRKGIEFVQEQMAIDKEVIRRYPAFIALAKEVVRKIHVNKNISDRKLRNFIWDINLMFHINDHTIDGEPLVFVTSDKAMLLASGVFHNNGDVLNYNEFKEHFQLMEN